MKRTRSTLAIVLVFVLLLTTSSAVFAQDNVLYKNENGYTAYLVQDNNEVRVIISENKAGRRKTVYNKITNEVKFYQLNDSYRKSSVSNEQLLRTIKVGKKSSKYNIETRSSSYDYRSRHNSKYRWGNESVGNDHTYYLRTPGESMYSPVISSNNYGWRYYNKFEDFIDTGDDNMDQGLSYILPFYITDFVDLFFDLLSDNASEDDAELTLLDFVMATGAGSVVGVTICLVSYLNYGYAEDMLEAAENYYY